MGDEASGLDEARGHRHVADPKGLDPPLSSFPLGRSHARCDALVASLGRLAAGTALLVLAGVDYEVAAFAPRPAIDTSCRARSPGGRRVRREAGERTDRAGEWLGRGRALVRAEEIVTAIGLGEVSDLVLSESATSPAPPSESSADARPTMVKAAALARRAGLPIHLVPVGRMPNGVDLAALTRY